MHNKNVNISIKCGLIISLLTLSYGCADSGQLALSAGADSTANNGGNCPSNSGTSGSSSTAQNSQNNCFSGRSASISDSPQILEMVGVAVFDPSECNISDSNLISVESQEKAAALWSMIPQNELKDEFLKNQVNLGSYDGSSILGVSIKRDADLNYPSTGRSSFTTNCDPKIIVEKIIVGKKNGTDLLFDVMVNTSNKGLLSLSGMAASSEKTEFTKENVSVENGVTPPIPNKLSFSHSDIYRLLSKVSGG